MKVLHITTSDSNGAGIAAIRILEAQRQNGIESNMIVRDKFDNHDHIKKIYNFKYVDYILNKFLRFFGCDYLFSFNSLCIVNDALFRDADVIHIHNVHYARMLHPWQLPKNKSYVFTLHDMWIITGFCNYNYDLCDKYITGCGSCPFQISNESFNYPKMLIDKTNFHWKLKQKTYASLNVIFTAPSVWLTDLAKSTAIIADKKVLTIPNCIEGYPDISPKRFIKSGNAVKLLFVGQKTVDNDRKGFKYIVELSKKLNIDHEIHIVGKNDNSLKDYFTNEKCRLVIHGSLPYLALQNVYKECDILLLPTLHDNFPNIILESFVFGTPVVAFNTGGVGDLVSAKTGYLAAYKSVDDLIRGIIYTMDNIEEISNYILNNSLKYSYKEISNKFENIYLDLIQNNIV